MTAAARLILASTVALAAGAGLLAGPDGADDPSLPGTLVRPAASAPGPDGGSTSDGARPG